MRLLLLLVTIARTADVSARGAEVEEGQPATLTCQPRGADSDGEFLPLFVKCTNISDCDGANIVLCTQALGIDGNCSFDSHDFHIISRAQFTFILRMSKTYP